MRNDQDYCPLSEYPRPQMKRESYICLNGYWDYSILPMGEKLAEYQGKILVPYSPEADLSEVNRVVTPADVLYYRRFFTLPAGFNVGRVLLHFGAVDYACKVFVNGTLVAKHKGGYIPFEADITDALKEKNELTLEVTDPTDIGAQARGKQKLKHGGIFYTPSSGIWQTVWLESVPKEYIQSIKIEPDTDASTVKISVISNADCTVDCDLLDGGIAEYKTTDESGACVIKLKNCKLWTPEEPKLYGLRITMGSDTVESYFGMRKFGIGKDSHGITRLLLNGKPYFHNGLLDQGYYADGLYTPASEEVLLKDLKMIKQMGFNMLRKHIKIEPLRWYYLCDKLGIIVWQDMVNGGGKCNTAVNGVLGFLQCKVKDDNYRLTNRTDTIGRFEYYKDLKAEIALLYNVVSLAVWVPFNESWGQFNALNAEKIVRKLDGTRLVDHASGWHDQGGGDFRSLHIYFRKLTLPHNKKDGRAIVLSEYGGYSLNVAGHMYNSKKTFGYSKYHTEEDLKQAMKKLYMNQVIPLIPKGLSATVYTQLSDVEEEINGLVTYDRQVVKLDMEFMRKLNEKVKL